MSLSNFIFKNAFCCVVSYLFKFVVIPFPAFPNQKTDDIRCYCREKTDDDLLPFSRFRYGDGWGRALDRWGGAAPPSSFFLLGGGGGRPRFSHILCPVSDSFDSFVFSLFKWVLPLHWSTWWVVWVCGKLQFLDIFRGIFLIGPYHLKMWTFGMEPNHSFKKRNMIFWALAWVMGLLTFVIYNLLHCIRSSIVSFLSFMAKFWCLLLWRGTSSPAFFFPYR